MAYISIKEALSTEEKIFVFITSNDWKIRNQSEDSQVINIYQLETLSSLSIPSTQKWFCFANGVGEQCGKHSWELISQCLNRNFWVKWENLCSQLTEWTLAPHTGLCSVVPAILIPHLLSVSTPPSPPQQVLTAPFQRTALATAGFLSVTPDLLYSAQPHLLAIYSLRPWILRLPNCPNIPLSLTVLHHILGLVLVSPPPSWLG